MILKMVPVVLSCYIVMGVQHETNVHRLLKSHFPNVPMLHVFSSPVQVTIQTAMGEEAAVGTKVLNE